MKGRGGECYHHSLVGGGSEVEDGCEGVVEGGGSAAEREGIKIKRRGREILPSLTGKGRN